MSYSEGDIVEVRCTDIRQDSEWQDLKDIRKKFPPPVKAIGYFLSEDVKCIRLISMYLKDEGDEEGGFMLFPRAVVDSVELIQESEFDDFK